MPWSILLQAAGIGLEAGGLMMAGRAESKSLKERARMARVEGVEAKGLSDYRVRLIRQAGAELLGEIEAETAQSGLAMTGTPLASLVDSARKIELSAAIENRSGLVQRMRYEQAAQAYEQEAKNAKKSGFLGGLGSLAGLAGLDW